MNLREGHELSPTQAALQPLTRKYTEEHELSDAQIKKAIQEFKRWRDGNKDGIKCEASVSRILLANSRNEFFGS